MTPRLILDLLSIAEKAQGWPQTHHLRNAALKELEGAFLSTVETITPVVVVNGGLKEKSND